MDLAWISLVALLVVIVVSCTTTVNPGFLAVVLAWVIGVYVADWYGTPLGLKIVVAGFPSDLFLTLVGVTLLFTQAQNNGTLDQVARIAVQGCRGNAGMIPVAFFVLALVFSTIGAGNIAASALISPLAMAAAARAGIPAFLMTLMVTHGCIAGAVSPFTPAGVVANDLMSQKMGLTGWEWHVYGFNLLANFLVAIAGYLAFGGWRLFGLMTLGVDVARVNPAERSNLGTELPLVVRHSKIARLGLRHAGTKTESGYARLAVEDPIRVQHWVTLGVIAALVVSVIIFKMHVGMGAFAGAVFLTLIRVTDEKKSVQGIPWSVILMVCGVTVLTALLERTGGMDRFARIISHTSNPQTITGIIALLTGLISVYSSTTGVVLPAFLPMVPDLVTELGGGDPLAIALSIIVGGNLVDASPLSTVGALCIASAAPTEDRRLLFNRLLTWGLAMSVVGALLCYVGFGLIGVR